MCWAVVKPEMAPKIIKVMITVLSAVGLENKITIKETQLGY